MNMSRHLMGKVGTAQVDTRYSAVTLLHMWKRFKEQKKNQRQEDQEKSHALCGSFYVLSDCLASHERTRREDSTVKTQLLSRLKNKQILSKHEFVIGKEFFEGISHTPRWSKRRTTCRCQDTTRREPSQMLDTKSQITTSTTRCQPSSSSSTTVKANAKASRAQLCLCRKEANIIKVDLEVSVQEQRANHEQSQSSPPPETKGCGRSWS